MKPSPANAGPPSQRGKRSGSKRSSRRASAQMRGGPAKRGAGDANDSRVEVGRARQERAGRRDDARERDGSLALHAQLGDLFDVAAGARATATEADVSGVDSVAELAMHSENLDEIVERAQETLDRLDSAMIGTRTKSR